MTINRLFCCSFVEEIFEFLVCITSRTAVSGLSSGVQGKILCMSTYTGKDVNEEYH